MNISVIMTTLVVNALLCIAQYAVQQWELSRNQIPARHSVISGTRQQFNHWQDAACQTWGDMLGLGIASSAFAHAVVTDRMDVALWLVFAASVLLGALAWYVYGTRPSYKPNWSFPKTGILSWGGLAHLAYFGLQSGIVVSTILLLSADSLEYVWLVFPAVGWSVYGVAVYVDISRGHKDRRQGV